MKYRSRSDWNLQPRTKLLRHVNAILNVAPCNHRVHKEQTLPPPNPGAMLFRLNSSSMHFLCYRKQHCNGGGEKQSCNLRQ